MRSSRGPSELGIETEIGVLAVALDEAAPLDPLRDPFHQGLKLLTGGGAMRRNTGGPVPVRNAPLRHSGWKAFEVDSLRYWTLLRVSRPRASHFTAVWPQMRRRRVTGA